MAWVLDCVARLGWLNRMTQFKEKAGKDRENASIGLYNYPVLMAADILSIARPTFRSATTRSSISNWRATSRRSSTTILPPRSPPTAMATPSSLCPNRLIQGPATRVMSLRDGTKKMSKSDPSEYAHIALTDDADTIAQKIRRAKTDPEPLPGEVDGLARPPRGRQSCRHLRRPERRDQSRRARTSFGGSPFSAFKTALADLTVEKLAPIRAEMLGWRPIPAIRRFGSRRRAQKKRARLQGRIWTRSRTSSASSASLSAPTGTKKFVAEVALWPNIWGVDCGENQDLGSLHWGPRP